MKLRLLPVAQDDLLLLGRQLLSVEMDVQKFICGDIQHTADSENLDYGKRSQICMYMSESACILTKTI